MNVLPTSTTKKLLALFILFTFAMLFLQFRKLNGVKLKINYARRQKKSRRFTAVCNQIIKGQRRVIKKANYYMDLYPKRSISPQEYISLTSNCEEFREKRGYILKALSKNEEEFPIAFSMNIYKDIEQFERLLRAIYRPQNYYCIHIDKKSPQIFHRAVENITRCFSNVFVTPKIIEVKWGEFSVLLSTILCMKDLWKRSNTWKYLINVSGQEFPLRTNNELVEILQKLKGKSIVRGEYPKKRKIRKRFLYVFRDGKRTEILKKPFRQNFTFYKGSTYVVLSRAFVDFILHDKLARDFLEWVRDTNIPDETYYPTLYWNVDFDKSFRNNSYNGPPTTRYVNWGGRPCYGKIVRSVCINGIGDLKTITRSLGLFVNKFYLDYQYLALDCLEEWLNNRTLAYFSI